MRKLTENQKEVLIGTAKRGAWIGGWVWGSQSATEAIFAALTKKGLARPTGDQRFTPCYYELTVEGKRVASELVAGRYVD